MASFFIILAAICGLITGIYGLYFGGITILGLLKHKKKQPEPVKPTKRIAAVVAARNEANVIGPLVRSLLAQEYPRELFDIYVLPNNCSDDTERAAERAGATILHCQRPTHSKGEVLNCAFDQLLTLPPEKSYDAFCIFDADNLVDSQYFSSVNKTLLDGYHIAQGYRDSKNPDSSWIAGDTSIFYWMMSRFYNSTRHALGMSAALNGTGFMISADLIRKHGFSVHSLTEDLEYTGQCALNDVKIGWMEDAIIYDEQPITLRDSMNQRHRWSAGTVQCLKSYGKKLFKKRSLECCDIFSIYFGTVVQVIGLLPLCISIGFFLRDLANGCSLQTYLIGSIWGLISGYAGSAFIALVVCLFEKKLTVKRIPAILAFPIFLITWVPVNLISIFMPAPKWKAIPHTVAVEHPDNT